MVLPCCYLAPVSWYRALAKEPSVLVEVCDSYRRQTLRNRCLIDSPQGVLALSVPVEKPQPGSLTRDIRVSDHGNWRHQHWNALKSSYRQSPFFEYYQDDFAPFYEKKWEFLADYNMELAALVCSLLGIDTALSTTREYGACSVDLAAVAPVKPYYQVFAHKHGFLEGLSIVDLLFNMGPESLLLL